MIEVLSTGIAASLQDLGRFGYRKWGIPVSGAMDQIAAVSANFLLGNQQNAPVIEFAYKGPILKFHKSTQISVSGAPFTPLINGEPVHSKGKITINVGDQLSFSAAPGGVYGYLAVAGGFMGEMCYQSVSYYEKLGNVNKLIRGRQIEFGKHFCQKKTPPSPSPKNTELLEVFEGPEFNKLSKEIQQYLLNQEVEVTSNVSRMGYRLKTEKKISAPEILTAPVQPGTVQLTPGGELIALMRDAQTTGGYSRVLQLTDEAISKLAQKRPFEKFKVSIVT